MYHSHQARVDDDASASDIYGVVIFAFLADAANAVIQSIVIVTY